MSAHEDDMRHTTPDEKASDRKLVRDAKMAKRGKGKRVKGKRVGRGKGKRKATRE
jgi:hypothetical protein